MARYISKPIELEAVLWTGGNHREMFDFLTGTKDEYMDDHGENFYIDHQKVEGGLIVKTERGDLKANIGDYVVRRSDNGIFVFDPIAFFRNFKPVE